MHFSARLKQLRSSPYIVYSCQWHSIHVGVVYSSACIVYSCQWHSIHVGVVYSVALNCFQTRIIEA